MHRRSSQPNPPLLPRLLLFTWLALGFSLILNGCNVGARTMALFGGELNIQVQIDTNANKNQPFAVDLLIVNDDELLKELMKLPAADWFAKRDQFKRDYPRKTGFESWEWEWTPGQRVDDQVLPIRVKAEAGLIFARYHTEGDHRARFDPLKNIRIEFKEDDFAVVITQGT